MAVLDWYSRYVISWAMEQAIEIDFVLQVVKQALAQYTPQIFNSDHRAAILPVHSTFNYFRMLEQKLAWTAKGGP